MGSSIELWGPRSIVGRVLLPDYWDEAKEFLKKSDQTLSKLINEYENPSLTSRGDVFYTLIRSIIGQQISAKAADSIWARFEEMVVMIDPGSILSCSHQQLRECGLSNRKVEYIRDISERWEVEFSSTSWIEMDDDEAISKLTTLRGVGVWTSEMILIFSLLRKDVFPLGDIGVIRAVEKLYNEGIEMDIAIIEQIAESWRPYRTVATWYLWRSIDSEPVMY
ncbi:MAG: DNA-3-methyladenine glycosylase [Euryarchaeota archaeon]|jgi:DNA-3-methyladenine glycosylase II|nr:DNA-3-methyladenine glycosylase [Euryarchaeota archaeon]